MIRACFSFYEVCFYFLLIIRNIISKMNFNKFIFLLLYGSVPLRKIDARKGAETQSS